MYFELTCPHCGQRLRLPESARGRRAACGSCRGTFDANQAVETTNPYAASDLRHGGPSQPQAVRRQPHRGGLILALAIIGILVCPIISFIAWFMGRADLRSMKRGVMDRDGEGLTKAGTIVALVTCVLTLAGFAISLVVISAMIVAEVAM